jgi:hypothetical protein
MKVYELSQGLDLYFQSIPCDIYYNSDLNIVQTHWKGFFTRGDIFRGILEKSLTLIQEKKSSALIADAREMKVITLEDQEWVCNNWYPRAIKAGFRKQALIITKDTFNEYSINNIIKNTDLSLVQTRYFTKFEVAAKWVQQSSEKKFFPFFRKMF